MIYTDEQRELAKTVRALVTKHANTRAAIDSEHGYDDKLWKLLCDQVGVAALAIPEEYGGIGATQVESNLVIEELGRVLAPTPMLGSVVLGAQTLLALDDEDARTRLLPGIAEGTTVVALCWAGVDGWESLGVSADLDGKLSGTVAYVLDGPVADVLIVVADTTDGIGFYEVRPADAEISTAQGMDPTRRFGTVTFDRTAGRRLGSTDGAAVLDRIRDIACAALAAEQVGAADRCLADTVEYTKSRVQFGRPIGSFQALKHRMADLYASVETARSMSLSATASLDPIDVAAAKVHCSEAFSTVAAESIQLHGGIAITWEHDAHLYFKRAHGDAHLFGDVGSYVRRFALVRD